MFDFDVLKISDPPAEDEPELDPREGSSFALEAPVSEVARGPALTLAPEATVAAAIELMRRRDRSAVVVLRQHRPVGIVSDRAILAQAFSDIDELGGVPLSAVMIPCPAPLREADTVGDVLRRMCALRQWHLPLVCSRGLMLGALDITDLALYLRDRMTLLSIDAALAGRRTASYGR
jgi:CBS domain-containing protein